MRLKGDPVVNAALDNAIVRESQFTRKGSTVCRAEKVYMTALNVDSQLSEPSSLINDTRDRERTKLTQQIKNKVKVLAKAPLQVANQEHLDTLMKQGEFLNLAQMEGKDPIWKSFIWNLPVGTAKFILNSTIHTLPTQNNLKLWNKTSSDKCILCGNRDSTLHTLSACKHSLEGGRYTWRHDNIINYIVPNCTNICCHN